MVINSVEINNYRSVESLKFDFARLKDNSLTFGLIGVNEAGKSSLLRALALSEGLVLPIIKDFFDRSKSIEVIYTLTLSEKEIEQLTLLFKGDVSIDLHANNFDFSLITRSVSIDISNPTGINEFIKIENSFSESMPAIIERILPSIKEWMPKAIFWTSEERFLISKPISLTEFAHSPGDISIPLRNCFHLAGITNISERLTQISDSTEKEDLQFQLGEKVTEHIKNVWPDHPVKITFLVSDGFINFHVKDENAKSTRTVDQRSDGFKQFVSFLLTVSAQNRNEELNNSILLLDEPETHLHPQAQEYLLKELINITCNHKNNIVLFATHSNYMIDKGDLSRNFRIIKTDERTQKKSFSNNASSYARVTYEVYGIATNDYHNELYGALQEKTELFLEKDFEDYLESRKFLRDINYTKVKGDKVIVYKVTLPTKIRNIIHHPENTKNSFNQKEMESSIEAMISLLHES